MPEQNYDEEYVTNILAEQDELNLKRGQFFGDQSKRNKRITERTKNNADHKTEHKTDQSQSNAMFGYKNHVNQTEQNKRTTSGQSDHSTLILKYRMLKTLTKWTAKTFTTGELPDK